MKGQHEDWWETALLPHEGSTQFSVPAVGWRGEWTDGRKLWNFPNGVATIAPHCKRDGEPHTAPQPECECGFRVVGDLDTLCSYWEKYLGAVLDIQGSNSEQPEDATGVAICKVEASGNAAHAIPSHGDPGNTIRAGSLRLVEIYAPDWMDRRRLERRYPTIPVYPLSDLHHFTDFPRLESGPFPEPMMSIKPDRTHFHITLAAGNVSIARADLQDAAIRNAIFSLAHRETGTDPHTNANLALVVDTFVRPNFPDITRSDHQNAAGMGIVEMLLTAATQE